MDIVTVVGARPQFIKAAVVSHAFLQAGFRERIVHTGQHYDPGMSDVFFSELGIPLPDTNLEVGSGSHGAQTGAMMIGLESYLQTKRPDWLVVYGDTNSTLACAIVGAKLGIPVAHVEAGLRSFNMRMPEEINRIVTDRLSGLLFCPTQTAVEHLAREGMTKGVHLTGDVMLDATRFFAHRAAESRPLESILKGAPSSYFLATVHRAENTDDPSRLEAILQAFGQIEKTIVWPVHPRTRNLLSRFLVSGNIRIIEPVSYLAMLTLISQSSKVLTDSGGLQKEAVWLGKPCITMRDETEWTETLEGGWNQIVGADSHAIVRAISLEPTGPAPLFGSVAGGTASSHICRILAESFNPPASDHPSK
ncbi:MAG: UDP-N-acetylglucosamine 2-epimerase (non-hydrolyzing) [Bacteroidetes bacterium]|nr:UDP-N-acetylglucosamine 2-epimerase (non-hydrolyzing) [Bacteroidota bacterium]